MKQSDILRKQADELDRIEQQRQESMRAHQEALEAAQRQLLGSSYVQTPGPPVQAPAPIPNQVSILHKVAHYITPADQMFISEHFELLPEIFAAQEGRDLIDMFLTELHKVVDNKNK